MPASRFSYLNAPWRTYASDLKWRPLKELIEVSKPANQSPKQKQLVRPLSEVWSKNKTNLSSPPQGFYPKYNSKLPVKKALLDYKKSNKPNATATKPPTAKPAKNPTLVKAAAPANPPQEVHSNLHSDLPLRDIESESQDLNFYDPSQEVHLELYPDLPSEEPALDQLESAYLGLNPDTESMSGGEFFDPTLEFNPELYSDLPPEESATDQLADAYLELFSNTGPIPKERSFDPPLEDDFGSYSDFIWGGTGPELKKLDEPTTVPKKVPIWPPPLVLERVCPDLKYEEIIVNSRRSITVRIYHPNSTSSSSNKMILYLPSNTTNFFPSSEEVISLLSETTSTAIITPVPATTAVPFPGSLHDLLKIYEYIHPEYPSNTQTAILAAGMAAPIATALAVTEPSIVALGVWGGVLDLTKYSGTATAWNRRLERWDFFPPELDPPTPKNTGRLGMTKEEFIAFRRHYYPNPEKWVDEFASPLLFFRSSDVDFSRYTMEEIFGSRAKELLREVGADEGIDWGEEGTHIYPRPQNSFMQLYPPKRRGAPFPKIRITLAPKNDLDDVTVEQGMMFVHSSRNCLAEWLHWKGGDMDDSKKEAEEMVFYTRLMAGKTWVDEVVAMGKWIKSAFNGSPTS